MATRTIDLFVPGRLCLFGEHSDWNASNTGFGSAIVVSTQTGIHARASLVKDGLGLFTMHSSVSNHDGGGTSIVVKLDAQSLRDAIPHQPYFAYALGAASAFLTSHSSSGVLNGGDSIVIDNYSTTLPIKKGLSTSAAVCVLVVRALSLLLLGRRRLDAKEEAEIAYQGERLTPSQCGRLDQVSVASLSDRPGQVGLVRFTGGDITCTGLPGGLLAAPVHLVVATCPGSKDTIAILSALQRAAANSSGGVRELFGATNEGIVADAAMLLQRGAAQELGVLASRAQALFDATALPACPSELTAPNLHRVLQDLTVRELSSGGKGVGAGGDGTCFLVARSQLDQTQLLEYLRNTLRMDAWAMDLGK